jgi:regulator of cell morphogenesis and NO signaling
MPDFGDTMNINPRASSEGPPVEPVTAGTAIAKIALRSDAHAAILDRYRLDFCCGGARTLAESCAAAGLDVSQLLTELNTAAAVRSASAVPPPDWSDRPLPELVDHIVETHHVFTRDLLARLEVLMSKVLGHHGERHPELARISATLQELAAELRPHMAREENVLFPYMRALARKDDAPSAPPFGTVRNPVRMMMMQHDRAAELLVALQEASGGFTVPEDACASYAALYAGLSALRFDLLKHVSLENNVLFPRAIALENRLLARSPSGNAVHARPSLQPDRT